MTQLSKRTFLKYAAGGLVAATPGYAALSITK